MDACNMFIQTSIFILSIAVILNALALNFLRKKLNITQINCKVGSENLIINNSNRLEVLLLLINYKEKTKNYHRANLISAIMDFAIINNDVRLEIDCLNELERIKTINTAENS